MASVIKTSNPPAPLEAMTVSGMGPTSGIPSFSTSGPWLIEEQVLNFDYARVPSYAYNPTTLTHSLSAPVRSLSVDYTFLVVKAHAEYSRTYSTDVYTTSGWVQPQKFIYNSQDNDTYGNSYGLSSLLGASALGPAGNVATKRKWYYRRPWVSGVDTTSLQVADGTLQYFKGKVGTDLLYAIKKVTPPKDGLFQWADFKNFSPDRDSAHSFLFWTNPQLVSVLPYLITGPYDAALETPSKVQQFIDTLGFHVSDSGLYGIGPNLTVSPLDEELCLADLGCSGYSPSRHEWN